MPVGPTWRKILVEAETSKPYYKELIAFLAKETADKQTIFPPTNDASPRMLTDCNLIMAICLPQVFAWSRSCSPQSIRVVVIGQDPYIQVNQAHGLCFSVKKGVKGWLL